VLVKKFFDFVLTTIIFAIHVRNGLFWSDEDL
jgi:hypothetical protein